MQQTKVAGVLKPTVKKGQIRKPVSQNYSRIVYNTKTLIDVWSVADTSTGETQTALTLEPYTTQRSCQGCHPKGTFAGWHSQHYAYVIQ